MGDLSLLPDLRLALLQGPLVWHNTAANLQYFSQCLAGLDAVDLVLLPEMFNTGFTMESATQAEPEMGPTTQWLLSTLR